MNGVVLELGHADIVKFAVGELGRNVARDTVADVLLHALHGAAPRGDDAHEGFISLILRLVVDVWEPNQNAAFLVRNPAEDAPRKRLWRVFVARQAFHEPVQIYKRIVGRRVVRLDRVQIVDQ